MLSGNYTPGPVIEARLRIYVNGVERKHLSASWGIDTTGGLPESIVNAGTGIRSRTGTITWASGTAITHSPFAPIGEGRWVPREGDDLVIEAEVGGVTFRRFTGRLGATTASLTGDTLTSDITDRLGDALQEIMSIEPAVTYQNGFIRSGWVAYRAIEQAGLGAVPRVGPNTVIHSGLQRGALPVVGRIIDSGIDAADPMGFFIRSGVKVGLATGAPPRSGRSILVVARAASQAPSRINLILDTEQQAWLGYNPATKTLSLYIDTELKWSGVYEGTSSPPLLAMQILKSGEVRVWVSRSKSVRTGAMMGTTSPLNSVNADALAGVTAQYLWVDSAADEVLATTAKHMPLLKLSALEQNYLPAIRGYENVTAREIVDAWGEATLGSCWMDELGRVNLVARDRLVTGGVLGTDRVEEKVFTGAWESGRDHIRSSVMVEGIESIHHGTWIGSTATVYQPSNIQEIDHGVPNEEFIRVPDDEDWIQVDTAWRPVIDMSHGANNIAEFDATSSGSWWHIGFEQPGDGEGVRWIGQGYENLSATLERLGQRALKMTHTVTGYKGPSKYILATPNIAVDALRLSRRGKPSPIIRAKWKVKWAKFFKTGQTLGPKWAASMKLDSDWYLEPEDAQRVADALASEVTKESITFSSLGMLWNPTVQVGDTRKLIGTGFDGLKKYDAWEAEYLVTGYSEDWEGNVPTWAIDAQCKVLRDLRAGKTYHNLRQAYGNYGAMSGTYAQVYQALPGKV